MTSDDEGTTRYHVTSVEGMERGDRLRITIKGREIVVFRGPEEFHAVGNVCQHQGAPMCEGRLLHPMETSEEGRELERGETPTVACPWHGWEYELTTGDHVAPTGFSLPSYEAFAHDGELFVEL